MEPLDFPGSPSANAKAKGIADGINTINAIRGDETFIKVQKVNGGLTVSLNIQAVVARVPKFVPSTVVAVVLTSYIGAGVYNAQYSTGTATAYNSGAGTITGLTLGSTCLAFDPPNYGSNASYGMISTPTVAPLIAYKFGVDSNSGKDMVAISGATGGC